jgi:predicted enzyme related to lactoylglutathione lyase
MGEVHTYPPGTFCWIDLGTTDVAGAKTFYRELFGWEMEDLPAETGTYTMCRLDGKAVAGMHEHSEEDGVGWSSSISVDDIDESTARAGRLGATVLIEPFEIPGAARMAVIRDASGAEVQLWQPKGHVGAGIVNEVGTWTWNELVTPDLDAAKAFYGELFGWTAEDIPGALARVSFALGDLLIGGAHAPTEAESGPARWTVSFRVADADENVTRAQQLGGTVLLPPMDIPVGRLALVSDPAGAAFSVTVFAGPFRSVDRS